MAKTVQPIAIELGIKGEEKLAALNRSFRDLSKQVKFSDADIIQATKDVAKFAQEAGNSEATIKGQIKAFEGLREQAAMGGKAYIQLGEDIESLKVTLRGSTDEMEKQRAAFVKTGNAAKSSASDIAGVISQLEDLRGKARPGSSAFAQLGKDIAALKSQLREANVEVKKFNAGFEIGQRPAMSLEKIQRQVGRLAEGLKTLNFISDDFLNTQERIALLGQVQSRTVGRQQVRAAEQLFSSQAFENFVQGPAGRLDLPRTAAALNLEISELQEQLANTVPGSKYADLTVEIANKQKELNKILDVTADAYDRVAAAQDRSARVAEKISGIQEYQRSTGGIAAGVGGFRDPETGAIIARGTGSVRDRRAFRAARAELANAIIDGAVRQARTLALPAAGGTTAPGTGAAISGGAVPLRGTRGPLRPIAELPTDLGTIGGRRQRPAGVEAEINDQARRSYISQTEAVRKNNEAKEQAIKIEQGYKAEIDKAVKANNQSINSTNRLRSALDAYRSTLPTTSKEFRNLTDQINKLDRQSEKTSRRMRGRRMSAGQLAQAAGATISGGIFGGPEGFLGGAIGTAFGGAGGAFAGAAIGAQVGGLRREVGGYAEYAAQIEKLKIALEGISGPQEEYNRALEAANSVTNDLNVPQEVAIRGITRLTAAVKGAGGGVADAELAFKNINSAIIATGGGAEQVEGAVTALVQIFSKGKVSAEEINQIAERLPGTFNKIAEASGRTGPQLTKALQDGEVGLNDLMKFLVQLGDEYGLLAEKIAKSSESAGARLQVAYDKMRQEIGKALQPIGAEFQDAFTEFLTDITPALVDAAKAVGDGMKFIFDNREAIGTMASLAAKIVAVNFAFKAFAALNGPVKAMFLMLQAEMGKTTAQAIVARSKLMGVLGAVKALSLVGIVTVTIDVVVTGLRDLARARKSIEELRGKVLKPGSVAAEFGGSIPAETKAEAEKILKQVKTEIKSIEDRAGLAKAVTGGRETIFSKVEDARLEELNLRRLELLQKIALPIRQKSKPKITVFDEPGLGEGEDEKGGKSKDKQQRKSQLESIRNGEKLLDIELMLLENSREIGKAQFENNFARVNELNNQKISLEFAKQAAQNEFEYRDAVAQAIGDENQAAIIQEAALKREIQDKLLLIQYEGALADEAQRRALEQKAAAKASQDELFSLREKLGLVSDQERISRYRTNLEEQGTPNADELTDLYRQTVDPTFAEGISQNIRALKQELEELLDPINQVTGAANAIGTAFTDSFMSAITGSATAQEALANFFSNTAKYFLDMAAQIIQKMITMAILNQVVGLLPGGGGFKFSGGSADAGLKAANLMGGITPFAMGGIVDKPTMFAYANGGVGRFGIMGEAGPEAILPLQRGPGGKLGVQASGGSVGDVVVNVDATGSSVEGNDQQAGQLGRAIGAAVQAELVKQKRPGGLLAD